MQTQKLLPILLFLLLSEAFSLRAVDSDFAIELVDLFDQDQVVHDYRESQFLDTLDSKTLVEALGFGWNLGNTLDAWQSVGVDEGLESETCWGNPVTTEEMIDELVKKGFKAVRIPVTWHNHLIDDKYTISPEWMWRVKTVIDWCINKGLYVILNTHHDNAVYNESGSITYGSGYYPLKKDMEESERFLYNVWRQIATAFNEGYDHHLIFEGMNEPRMVNLPNEWHYTQGDDLCEESVAVVNQYNKLVLKAIRSTGGNNKKRFVLVTGNAASYEYTVNSKFVVPDDPDNEIRRVLVSVHMYAPYEFVMEPNVTNNKFTPAYRNELYQNFKKLYTKFIKNGYYVVLGEMGIVNKNNTQARIEWGKYYLESCRNFQMSAFLWDNGIWDNTEKCDDTWAFFRRDELTWENGNFIDALLNAAKNEFKNDYELFEVEPIETFDKTKAVQDFGEKKFDVSLSSKDIIDQLGFGWNLGNTFDAFNDEYLPNQGLSSETCWGNPKTTVEMLDTLVKKGVKTLRIPVSWHNHLIDDKYTIDPEWMYRVKTVVDWAVDQGLYVILNTHHDQAEYNKEGIKYGQGYYPLLNDAAESEKYIYNIWKQIVTAFNNGYDHHLIFEGLNEPRLKNLVNEWWYNENDLQCKEAARVLNEYNRLVLKAIRDSKGNNLYRFVMTTGLAASISSSLSNDFVIPEDKIDSSTPLPNNYRITNRVLVSVHLYAPYDLVMNPDMSINKFTEDLKDQLYDNFKNLYLTFIKKGYNIVVGEMGVVNKNNPQERINWAKYFVSSCRKYQMAPVIWDNGNWNNTVSAEETFGFFDRRNLEWVDENLMNSFIKSASNPLEDNVDIFETELRETFDTSYMIIDQNEKFFDDVFTSKDLIDQMQFGWNLGNSFDAFSDESQNQGLSSETCWGNPETTEALLDALVKKGFKAIRIPVTWHNHLVDDKYTIDSQWMTRVKQVVDWCIDRQLYVILNTHHDNADYTVGELTYGKGYYPLKKDMKHSEKFLYNIWKQIAYAFNEGYDQHLIFEGLNEPRLRSLTNEWWFNANNETCQEASEVLNEYHRLIVKAIRETGRNNEKRFIMVGGLAAAYDSAMNSGLVLPDDNKYNPRNKKLLLSVHMYSPYEFAMKPDMTINTFTTGVRQEMFNMFKNLYFKYIQSGTHVVVGEMGTVNKNNTDARTAWGVYYLTNARRFQFTPFIWDNNQYNNTVSCEETFGQFVREDLTWANAEMIDRYLIAAETPLSEDPEVFRTDPEELYEKLKIEYDYGEVEWNDTITAEDVVQEMGFGWNLGNTLDAFDYANRSYHDEGLASETSWDNPVTTEEMIDALIKKGVKAVRIPVTWHNHLIDRNYTIDKVWMWRVKQIVDWCIYKGLYVILNTHHDQAKHNNLSITYAEGYYPLNKDVEESERFLYNIWKQIATAFNNGYDHHLVFEGLNEPRLADLEHEWNYDDSDDACKEAADVLNEYNKLILNTIRTTAGNNAYRFVMVTPLAASYDAAVYSNFVIPNDKKYNPNNNKLIVSVHMYSPYEFAMKPDTSIKEFTEDFQTTLHVQFEVLFNMFIKTGYSLIIGEFGAVDKNNTEARLAWGKYFMTSARKNHMTAFWWDNGKWDNSKTCDDVFGNFKRNELTWVNDELFDLYVKTGKLKLGSSDIYIDDDLNEEEEDD